MIKLIKQGSNPWNIIEENVLLARRANLIFLFLTAINILVLSSQLNKYVLVLKNLLYYVALPVPYTANQIIDQSQNVLGNIGELVRVHQENIILKEQLREYIISRNEFIKEKSENERLRNMFGFSLNKNKNIIVAKVFSREPGSWFQWVLVNKGSKDGVVQDSPVVVISKGELIAVGRVREIYKSTSKVILITNVLSSIPSMSHLTYEDGLIEGQNDVTLRFNYLLPKNRIALGEKVVVSQLSTVFPSGTIIGEVSGVTKSEDKRFSSLTVKPEINFNSLKEVLILSEKIK